MTDQHVDPTPATWAPGTMPTPVEALAWVRAARDDEVLVMLDSMLDDYQAARRCVMAEHDRGMQELTAAQHDRARWQVIRDYVLTHRPAGPTARRVRELMMGEDHREDPPVVGSYEEMAQRATTDTAYRAGLLDAAVVARAQGTNPAQPPCPSDVAAIYIERIAEGETP